MAGRMGPALMTLRVELYGFLGEALGRQARLDFARRPRAREVLQALADRSGEAALLKGAVLATEEEVLGGEDLVPLSGRLAALPPVCGG